MHDHRQALRARDRKLRIEVMLLRVAIQAFDEEIQPAFAHRHRALARDPRLERIEVCGLVR